MNFLPMLTAIALSSAGFATETAQPQVRTPPHPSVGAEYGVGLACGVGGGVVGAGALGGLGSLILTPTLILPVSVNIGYALRNTSPALGIITGSVVGAALFTSPIVAVSMLMGHSGPYRKHRVSLAPRVGRGETGLQVGMTW